MNTESVSEDRRSDLKTRKMKRRDGPRSEGWEQGRSLRRRPEREGERQRERQTERERRGDRGREREVPGVSNNNLYKHTLIIHVPFQCWRENPKFTEHN